MRELLVQSDATRGRHVVADRDYQKNELVATFFPFCCSILDNNKKRVCAYCLKWNEIGRYQLSCDLCDSVYFCSSICQTDFTKHHRHFEICQLERKLATWKADKDARSLMRLYLKYFHMADLERRAQENPEWYLQENNSQKNQGEKQGENQSEMQGVSKSLILEKDRENQSEKTENLENQGDNLEDSTSKKLLLEEQRKSIQWESLKPGFHFTLEEAFKHFELELSEEWKSRISDPKILQETLEIPSFREILPLQTHIGDWSKEDLRDWHKHKTFLRNLRKYFGEEDKEEEPEDGEEEKQILSLISAFESNNFGLWSPKGEVLGRLIYPRASYFNHACDSNCYTERKGPLLFIVAQVDIKQGEEMTISYIDTNQPRSARQNFLSQHYHFACQCQRCQSELNGGSKVKLTYEKSKNNTQKTKIPKRKMVWKEKQENESDNPDKQMAQLMMNMSIYLPLPEKN